MKKLIVLACALNLFANIVPFNKDTKAEAGELVTRYTFYDLYNNIAW